MHVEVASLLSRVWYIGEESFAWEPGNEAIGIADSTLRYDQYNIIMHLRLNPCVICNLVTSAFVYMHNIIQAQHQAGQ